MVESRKYKHFCCKLVIINHKKDSKEKSVSDQDLSSNKILAETKPECTEKTPVPAINFKINFSSPGFSALGNLTEKGYSEIFFSCSIKFSYYLKDGANKERKLVFDPDVIKNIFK